MPQPWSSDSTGDCRISVCRGTSRGWRTVGESVVATAVEGSAGTTSGETVVVVVTELIAVAESEPKALEDAGIVSLVVVVVMIESATHSDSTRARDPRGTSDMMAGRELCGAKAVAAAFLTTSPIFNVERIGSVSRFEGIEDVT